MIKRVMLEVLFYVSCGLIIMFAFVAACYNCVFIINDMFSTHLIIKDILVSSGCILGMMVAMLLGMFIATITHP